MDKIGRGLAERGPLIPKSGGGSVLAGDKEGIGERRDRGDWMMKDLALGLNFGLGSGGGVSELESVGGRRFLSSMSFASSENGQLGDDESLSDDSSTGEEGAEGRGVIKASFSSLGTVIVDNMTFVTACVWGFRWGEKEQNRMFEYNLTGQAHVTSATPAKRSPGHHHNSHKVANAQQQIRKSTSLHH